MGSYREVLGRPYVTRILVTSLWARLAVGMQNIALLLFLAPHIGYGRSGLASGVAVATGGASNIALSRAIDRYGGRVVLVPCSIGYAACMGGLALCGSSPYLVQLALCAVAGVSLPPAASVARGLYSRLLPSDVVGAVFGVEATAQELVYIVGPAGVALLAAAVGAGQAVAVTGLVCLTGTIAFCAVPVMGRPLPEDRVARRSIRRTGVLSYAAAGAGIVACFSMVEVGVVAVVGGKQASATSGFVLALWSVGSMAGGLLFARSRAVVTDRALAIAMVSVGASVAVLALAPDDAVLAVLLLLGGATIAPCLARLYTQIGAAAPAGSSTEAFGWLSAGFLAGASVGSSAAGVLVDSVGGHPTFAIAAGAVAVCTFALPAMRQQVVLRHRGPATS